ncbi:MAG: N-acetyltransferase [Spirosomataceae bacterium]
MKPSCRALPTSLAAIMPFRALFLQELNRQIRYNAAHERGWTDSYNLIVNGVSVGYASVKGQEISNRDTIFEFYVIPPFRTFGLSLFRELLTISQAQYIEAQSNDLLLTAMLYEVGTNIRSDVILFEDYFQTAYPLTEAVFRPRQHGEFLHHSDELGDFVIEFRNEVVAMGGFLRHYNPPFADLYMEVKEIHRQQGWGTQILQEIKKECYLAGRIPAARCNGANIASKATLLKAGFRVSGHLLIGELRNFRDM